MKKDKKWIQKMDLKKGALTKTAKEHGGINKEGKISAKFLDKAASGKYGAKTEKRAELAKTFKKMSKGKSK